MKGILRILIVTALMIIIGSGMFIFSSCDDQDEGLLPHEHLWGDWELIKSPTCSEDGEMELYCSLCGYTKSVTLDRKPHTEGEPVITREPTCTQNGEMQTSCTVCGHINITEIETKGHTNNSQWEVVRESTCAAPGKRVIRCVVCGDIVKSELIRILPHTYGDWVVVSEPTCTENGSMRNECTECGYPDKQTIPATGHAISEWVVDREATCTRYGRMHADCTVCGEEISEIIPANGHTDGEWIIVSEPTCSSQGKRHTLCTICGEVTKEEILPAAHVFNDNYECIFCGINLGVAGQKIIFEFGEKGKEEHMDGGNLGKEFAYTFEEYTLSFTDMYKIFAPSRDAHGNSCIKIGTADTPGTLSFTVPDEVYAVIINIAKYKDYESKVIINGTEYTLTKNSHDGEYDIIVVDTSITKTVTISTVDNGKRAMMDSIVFVLTPDAGECQHSGGNATCQTRATCSICGEKYGELGEHNYADSNCCYDCGNIDISCFDFTLLDDGTYSIRAKNVDNMPSKVVIPNAYDGKLVTVIGDSAFSGCANIIEITMPDSITYIDAYAFVLCNIISIEIPESVTTIVHAAFAHCYSLKSIKIPDSVTLIDNYVFRGCTSLTSIVIPDSVTTLGHSAFRTCTNLTNVVIGNGITNIDFGTFDGCTNLVSIIIGNGVTTIRESFSLCESLDKIYYNGSEEEWNKISIENSYALNDYLVNATRYYYSEIEPTTEGNFWHWVDGEPTVWEVHVHTEEIIPAVGATCTNTGLTEGKKCSVCGEILIAQETVPAIGHSYVDGNCEICGVTSEEYFEFTLLEDGTYSIKAKDVENMPSNVVIPRRYSGTNITKIGENAFKGCNLITCLTIPASITEIHYSAFGECNMISKLFIVVENATPTNAALNIGMNFYNPSNQTRKYFIDEFGNEVTDIIISESCTSINYASFAYSNVTSIYIPRNVTYIDYYAFEGCENLTKFIGGEGIKTVCRSAFYNTNAFTQYGGCYYIRFDDNPYYLLAWAEDTEVEEYNIHSDTKIIARGAFANCSSTKRIIIPSDIKIIIDALEFVTEGAYYCGSKSKWDNVSWHDGYTNNYNSSDKLFYYSETEPTEEGNFWHWVDGEPTVWEVHVHTEEIIPAVGATCTNTGLTEGKKCSVCGEILIAQETIPAGHNYVDSNCCSDCGNVDISYFDFTLLDDGTYEISAKDASNMPSNVVIPSTYANSTVSKIKSNGFYNCDVITSIVTFDGLINIGNYAFAECSNLTNAVIADSVVKIEHCAFDNCKNLSNLTIGNNITHLGHYAFLNCSKIFNIYNNCRYIGTEENPYMILVDTVNKTLSTYDIHEDTRVIAEYAFAHVFDYLTSIVIPDNVEYLNEGAFASRRKLTSVTFGKNLKVIGDHAFYECDKIAEIVLPEGLTHIGTGAFYACSKLNRVVIPDSVTAIEDWAFTHCSSLTSVVIGNSVSTIGSCSFHNCDNLTYVKIGDNVSLIKDSAFSECEKLSTIVLPKSITLIEEYAFDVSPNLKNIYYCSSYEDWSNIIIETRNSKLVNYPSYRYYYSETEPTTEGNFWHWVDGEPVAW